MAAKPLETLQAGRGIAAVLVVLFHCSKTIFQTDKFFPQSVFGNFFDFGHAGVVFFFVLSGFIILSAHHRDIGHAERTPTFLLKRFFRVYPAYWIVLLPIAALYLLRPELSRPELAAPAVIANSFLLIGLDNNASLAVAWTLFHEILFYLFFAVLIFHRAVGVGLMAGWFAACAILAVVSDDVPYHLGFLNLLFLAGMVTFWLTERYRVPLPALVTVAGAALFVGTGLIEINGLLASPKLLTLGYGIGSVVAVLGCVAWERKSALTVSPLLKLLGDASYSIYLVHYPALSIVARVWLKFAGGLQLPPELVFILLSATVIAAGIAFHLLIEKRLLRWSRTFTARKAERTVALNPHIAT